MPIIVDERAGGESQAGDNPQLDDDHEMSDQEAAPFVDAATSLRPESPIFQDSEVQANGRSHHDSHLHDDAEMFHSELTTAAFDRTTELELEEMSVTGKDDSQSGFTQPGFTQHEDTEMSDSIEETTEDDEAQATRLDGPNASRTAWVAINNDMEAEDPSRIDEVHGILPPKSVSNRALTNTETHDNEDTPFAQVRNKGPKRPVKQSIYVAEVAETAIRVDQSTADLDNSVVSTIQKMLSRADQVGANETEAKTALRMATKLMHRFNVTKAEVLTHDPEKQQKHTGQSLINIRRRDRNPNKSVMMYVYVDTLMSAISTFFGTRSYSKPSPRGSNEPLVITFYGIAENTGAAAHAFEMSYNLIVGWSLKYKGTSQRNSYCLGVCDALQSLAQEEKAAEERKAIQAGKDEKARRIRQEEADEQARLDRLNPPVHDLSDDEDDLDVTAAGRSGGRQDAVDSGIESQDFEHETSDEEDDTDEDTGDNAYGNALHDDDDGGFAALLLSTFDVASTPVPNCPTAESTSTQPAGIDSDPEPSWSNHAQLILYRETSDKMAEDFLKEKGIELRAGRAKKVKNLDRAVYRQGKKDAKKIDVRRPRQAALRE